MKTPITEEEILAARTPKGAWKRAQLAEWGVPWPPPQGWKAQIISHGYPYDPALSSSSKFSIEDGGKVVTEAALQSMMDNSKPQMIDGEPFDCVGDLDIDPAQLLRKVVSAVISADRADILWEFPEVLAFFGSRIPQREDVTHLHSVDQRMFDAADRWPNRKPST